MFQGQNILCCLKCFIIFIKYSLVSIFPIPLHIDVVTERVLSQLIISLMILKMIWPQCKSTLGVEMLYKIQCRADLVASGYQILLLIV